MSYQNIQSDLISRKKVNLTRKDFEKISEWYQSCKQNYFSQTTFNEPLRKEQLKEVHLKIYFSQIYLTEISIHTHFETLRNLSPKPLTLNGGIFKSEDKQFQGKPYEYKNIESTYNSNTRSLILSQQINLFTYCLETKKRDSVFFLEFALANSEGQLFRLGKLLINVNATMSEISELSILGKKGQKVGFIQSIIEKDPIDQIHRFLPTNVIIDQNAKIPSIKSFQIKNKRESFTLESKAKIIIENLAIQIPNKSKLIEKIQKNNPFTTTHYENVQIVSTNFKILFGSHNSYKLIEYEQEMGSVQLVEDLQKTLSQLSKRQSEDVLYLKRKEGIRKMRKTYFECQKTVFIVMLVAQVQYKLNGLFQDSRQMIGWCVLQNRLYENHVMIECLLENTNSIMGYPIEIHHVGIKVRAQIENPDFKYFNKKFEDDFALETSTKNLFIDPNMEDELLTKTFFVTRQATQMSDRDHNLLLREEDEIERETRLIMEQLERQLQRQPEKMTLKGRLVSAEFVNNTERSLKPQADWEHLLSMENKVVKFGVKLFSIIPNTDETSMLSGKYYLPLRFKVKIYFLRTELELEGSFQEKVATFNIPSFVKSKKQMTFMEALIHNKKEISKILDSSMIIHLTDLETNKFYAKGAYKAKRILTSKDTFKIGIELQNGNSKMGELVLEMSVSIRSRDVSYKREIQMIEKDKILYSLPMKERMMMRISNFNKSSKEMENKAIEIYKAKTHMAVVNKIISEQINNFADIEYELGDPSYFLLKFKNESSSENNQFTLFIHNCNFAEIVTDQTQYKQACLDGGFEIIPYHKITFQMEKLGQPEEKFFYTTKILHKTTVPILLKIYSQDWNPHITQISNFTIEILRNTMPVVTHKFRINFRQPLISETVSMEEINPRSARQLSLYLPQNITQKYTSFVSLSKSLTIKSSKGDFKVEVNERIKCPYKFELMVQGKLIGLNSEDKYANILIEILLLEGEFMEVELGNICNKSFPIDIKANPSLLNQVLVIHQKSPSSSLQIARAVYIMTKQQRVSMKVCSFESGVQNVVLNFYDLNNTMKYQYLLKIITKLKTLPIPISVQNYAGEKVILTCPNPYVDKCQFVVTSNANDSLFIERELVPVYPKSAETVVVEILTPLASKCFVAIYDDFLMLVRLYQFNPIDKNLHHALHFTNQITLRP